MLLIFMNNIYGKTIDEIVKKSVPIRTVMGAGQLFEVELP